MASLLLASVTGYSCGRGPAFSRAGDSMDRDDDSKRTDGIHRRCVAGEDLKIVELEHPGLPTVSLERSREGDLLASWALPERRLRSGMDLAESLAVVTDLLMALEFLYESGFVIEDLRRSDVRLDAQGRAVIAPLSLFVRRRSGELPYAGLVSRLLGDVGSRPLLAPSSFHAWFTQLYLLGRGGLVEPRFALGRRPLFDRELDQVLGGMLGGERRSFAVDGAPGSGRGAFLRRVSRHALARGARTVVLRGDGEAGARSIGTQLGFDAPDGPCSSEELRQQLKQIRSGARRLVILVDQGMSPG